MPKVSNGKRYCSYNAAQPAHAADRCAREILAILALFVVRARRLMGNSLAGSSSAWCFVFSHFRATISIA